MRQNWLFFGLLLSGLFYMHPSLSLGQNERVFPPLEGELLSGDEVIFPADLSGSAYMVIMSFDRDQEAQIQSWIKAAKALPNNITLFEVALIGKVGGIARFFIKGGMRDMEQYKSRKDKVMPFFRDADAIKAKLNITDISQVHAFLITKDGDIIWQDKAAIKINIASFRHKFIKGYLEMISQ